MNQLHLDFETRSIADIKRCGTWAYTSHESTTAMCVAFSFNGWPVELLTSRQIEDGELFDHGRKLPKDTILTAHSAHFEYGMWLYFMERLRYAPFRDPANWKCTLAKCAMCNLPISLDAAGAALNTKTQKDLMGRSAMLKLSRPISVDALGFPTYREDEDLKKVMYEYCKKDVEAEMELDARLPELPPGERKLWELDLLINRRGVKADVLTAARGVSMASAFTETLNTQLTSLTNGAVEKASRVAAIKKYLASYGVVTESLDKASVTKLLLDPSINPVVKEVIKIRQQVGKSSTAKYQAILDYAGEKDQRMRGLLQYHAAGTGRWGGRGPQPQNFPKGLGEKGLGLVPGEDGMAGDEFQEAYTAQVSSDMGQLRSDAFWERYGAESMNALSAGLRGVLTAGEGKMLVAADYSAIEARVLLWLCGDHFALAKYKMGVDLYIDMAKSVYNRDNITKADKLERNVGKFLVLGCGYGLGAKKMALMCQQQGIDVTEEFATAAVQAYRKKYKKVVEFWYATEKAARAAVRTPGSVHSCGGGDLGAGLKAPPLLWGMDKRREFLVCKLPSGRHLRYFRPRLKSIETPYGEKEEIHYWCAGLGGKLEENKTYGGSLVENIVQGTARDIMANGMIRAEESGFPVVLTVHDELVTEIPFPHYTPVGKYSPLDTETAVKDLIEAMCSLPPWANGCPIAAEGWMGKRYRK